jgi:hypothetical protein
VAATLPVQPCCTYAGLEDKTLENNILQGAKWYASHPPCMHKLSWVLTVVTYALPARMMLRSKPQSVISGMCAMIRCCKAFDVPRAGGFTRVLRSFLCASLGGDVRCSQQGAPDCLAAWLEGY